jgi:hypothetical protein
VRETTIKPGTGSQTAHGRSDSTFLRWCIDRLEDRRQEKQTCQQQKSNQVVRGEQSNPAQWIHKPQNYKGKNGRNDASPKQGSDGLFPLRNFWSWYQSHSEHY